MGRVSNPPRPPGGLFCHLGGVAGLVRGQPTFDGSDAGLWRELGHPSGHLTTCVISSRKPERVRTSGSADRHTCEAFMATPNPDPGPDPNPNPDPDPDPAVGCRLGTLTFALQGTRLQSNKFRRKSPKKPNSLPSPQTLSSPQTRSLTTAHSPMACLHRAHPSASHRRCQPTHPLHVRYCIRPPPPPSHE